MWGTFVGSMLIFRGFISLHLKSSHPSDPPFGPPVPHHRNGRVRLEGTDHPEVLAAIRVTLNWVWLKIKQEGLRRFWSMFPLTRVSILAPAFRATANWDWNGTK